MSIAVDDSEYADLLIRLPSACEFIDSALAQGGRVLVHCVMGISRSATVVAAYRTFSISLSHLRSHDSFSNESQRNDAYCCYHVHSEW